jgi:DNA helicase II / ATP-dependent DNA helicase PcrA
MFAPSAAWDQGLDDVQLAAVTHGDGPLIIVAGAGTGKTQVLTARVAYLLERGVSPERVLLLTFTRRAADEMIARAANVAHTVDIRRPVGGTFHAIAHSHVAAYAEVLGLPKSVGILDPASGADLMELLREEHGLSGTEQRFPRSSTLVEIYSRSINNDRRLSDLLPAEYPWCEPHREAMGSLFRAYTARKKEASLLDFDDLLLGWRALLNDRAIGAVIADRFEYVLVDEYQDLNALQVDIVTRLAPGGLGLTVVGDQAQAVYAFRGADPAHLRRVAGSFPDATVVRLETNFRSSQPILNLANVVRPPDEDDLRLSAERVGGCRPTLLRCYDASSESRAVVDRILQCHQWGSRLRDQAVLVRAAHHSDLIEVELAYRKVPYRKYGGLRFLEAAHVKDFVSAARILENPNDEVAWFRILRLHRNIGPARARSILRSADLTADLLAHWPEVVAAAPAGSRSDLSVSLSGLARARDATSPGKRADEVLHAIRPLVVEKYSEPLPRIRDLERLIGSATTIDDFSRWLAGLTLDPPISTADFAKEPSLDEDYVVISTIHSAKGLEWQIVHLPHVVDGALPSDMAIRSAEGIDEERRLFYVAITRARDELHLYSPLRMPHRRHSRDDRHSFAQLSRFVDDKALSVLEVVEEQQPVSRVVARSGERVTVDLSHLWA